MSYTTKNYSKQGGEEQVVGGTLIIEGTIDFSEATEVKGNVAFQADSTASTVAGVVTDLNALIAKLIASGLMAAE